ncbi:hypothetical protein HDU76_004229 [Blyttiomyces sp. JEL0837]|nr:hypothetical protein HDU76_004229 [Blyttiomyces sp. JEL0837]
MDVMLTKDKSKIVISESLFTGVVPSKASKIDELLDGDGGNKILKDGNDNVDDVNDTDLMKDMKLLELSNALDQFCSLANEAFDNITPSSSSTTQPNHPKPIPNSTSTKTPNRNPNTGEPSNKTIIIQYPSKLHYLTRILNNHHVTPILKATRDLHIPIFSKLVGSIVDIASTETVNNEIVKENEDSQEVGISNVINKLGRLNLELKGYIHANPKVVGDGPCALLMETSVLPPPTSSLVASVEVSGGNEDISASTVDTNQRSMGSNLSLSLSRRVPIQQTIIGSHLTPQETFKRALDEKFRERSGEFWENGGVEGGGDDGGESGIEKLRSRMDKLRRRRKSLESRSPSSQCESVDDGESGGGEEERGRSVGRGGNSDGGKVIGVKVSSRWEEDRVWLEGPLKVHGCSRKVSGDVGGGIGEGNNDDGDVGVAADDVPRAAMV